MSAGEKAAAYVPGFEYDIFISYAHVNNRRVMGATSGWVDAFERDLRDLLWQKSGRIGKIKIWRDPTLEGTQVFSDEIRDKIRNSALFIALASKGYHESDYCRSELKEFFQEARRVEGGLRFGNHYRIVTVLLEHIPQEEKLRELGDTLGFCFHDAPPGAEPWEGYPVTPTSEPYDKAMKRLVGALYKALEEFRAGRESGTGSEAADAEASKEEKFELYFADVSDTLRTLRRRVSERIMQKDPQVKVSKFLPPPYDVAKHDVEVLEKVKNTRLSIHMFDSVPGREIEDQPGLTYPQRQAQLARDHARSQLVVWVPEGSETETFDRQLSSIDDDHKSYRDLLHDLHELAHEERNKGGSPLAHEFLRVPYKHDRRPEHLQDAPEQLAEEILQRIDRLRGQTANPTPSVNGVLVDTHSKDIKYAIEIGGYLARKGVQVHLVPQSESEENARMLYEETLRRVRTLLIVFGNVAEEWARARFTTALKRVVDDQCLVSNIFIYLAPPKKTFRPDHFKKGFITPTFIDNMNSDTIQPNALANLLT